MQHSLWCHLESLYCSKIKLWKFSSINYFLLFIQWLNWTIWAQLKLHFENKIPGTCCIMIMVLKFSLCIKNKNVLCHSNRAIYTLPEIFCQVSVCQAFNWIWTGPHYAVIIALVGYIIHTFDLILMTILGLSKIFIWDFWLLVWTIKFILILSSSFNAHLLFDSVLQICGQSLLT